MKVVEGENPELTQCENGSEFRSMVFVSWAYEHSVKLDFTLSGKHLNNPFDESFNEEIRDVGLKVHSYL